MPRELPDWVEGQLRRRGIHDERVLEAMAAVPREAFVPADWFDRAYEDGAIPIAFGQTVSQPYIVGLMAQGLRLTGSESVLDVGTGSGYAAAVLAELAREVHSIERIPELAESARAALDSAGYGRVQVHTGDGSLGLAAYGPYDAIAVAAAAREVPPALWEQLREGGRMAIPLRARGPAQELCILVRKDGRARLVASVPARFVPLV